MNGRVSPTDLADPAARRFANSLLKPQWWVVRRSWVPHPYGGTEARDTDWAVERPVAATMIASRRSRGLPVTYDASLHGDPRPHCYRWDESRGPRDMRVTYFLMSDAEYDQYCARTMV